MNHTKKTIAIMGLAVLTLAITTFCNSGQQYAFAQKGQMIQVPINILSQLSGLQVGSPGILSGNVIQVPINIPINVCGNSIVGSIRTTFGNICVNPSG
jgi:small secreted domain DUF320